ncbi:MAG TPA: GspH/FimT family pseudopilin [Solimonas sp.]|nr:GspH/FimT family pseudopilin [Solimonas sp.]
MRQGEFKAVGRTAGYTLPELLTAMAVLAILCAVAVPGFRGVLLDNARAATVNELVSALAQARSEAQKQGRATVVCPLDAASQECAPGAANWDHGWLVYVNMDAEFPPAYDAADRVVRRYAKPSNAITARGGAAALVFRPSPSRAGNGTVTFCDLRGTSEARQVIVSPSGRIRTADGAPACA